MLKNDVGARIVDVCDGCNNQYMLLALQSSITSGVTRELCPSDSTSAGCVNVAPILVAVAPMLLPFNSLRVDIATVFPGNIASIGKSSDPEARKYIMIDQELE